MVGRGRPRNATRRNADRGNDGDQRDPRDIEIERLQQRVRDLELQQEARDEETESEPSVWDARYEEDENPFGTYRRNIQGQRREDPLRNMGIKIEIPDFHGNAQPDEFID